MTCRRLVTFLDETGGLVTINKAVSSEFEAAAVQAKIFKETGKAVLFTNIDGKGKNMLGNIYTSRKMLSYLFDVQPEKLVDKVLSFKACQAVSREVRQDRSLPGGRP